jgi:hypothetical protein
VTVKTSLVKKLKLLLILSMTINHHESEPEQIEDLVDIPVKIEVATEKIDSFDQKLKGL